MFTHQAGQQTAARAAASRAIRMGSEMEIAKFDLTLSITEMKDGMLGGLQYNADLFEEATATRLVGHFLALLGEAAASPERAVSDLAMMSPVERHEILVDWNETRVDFGGPECAHQLVEGQARQRGAAVALTFDAETLSYAELERRANCLAHHLHGLGVRVETPVGLCLERGPQAIIGLLGILKAGGVYLPLDPNYPGERLKYMVEDARPAVILSQESLRARLPEGPVVAPPDSPRAC